MSLLWIDGFDHFTNGANRNLLDDVYVFPGNTGVNDVGVFGVGRTGGRAVFNDEGGTQIGTPEMFAMVVSGLSTDATWIVGFACRIQHTFTEETEFLQFKDSSGDFQFTINYRSGCFNVRQGSIDATVIGVCKAPPCRTWFFFEIKILFHASAGTITIRLNEEEVLALTGLNTAHASGGELRTNAIWFCGSNSSQRTEYDDFYICDGAGSLNNNFLGDVAGKRLTPNGNGTTNNFTGSDGDSTDNYLQVDEDGQDTNTYNSSTTIGHKDLYAFTNLSSTPSAIAGLHIASYDMTSTSGTFGHLVRSNVTEDLSAAITPGTSFTNHYSVWETDPDTSAAWTEAGVNAAEFGVEVIS